MRDVVYKRFDMHPFFYKNAHIKWRVNRMKPSRKLRKLFPRLAGIPDWWSPSTEKFILIDGPEATSYTLVR